MQAPTFFYEDSLRSQGFRIIAGVDEAGRGPLAGPVVAAAVILPLGFSLKGLTDSKQLSARQREKLFFALRENPDVKIGVGFADAAEIDACNILQATYNAMHRAVGALDIRPDHVLVDGRPVRPFAMPQTAIVRGDSLSVSIAAASIIAKVTRDQEMLALDARWPQYGFAKHKGYGTRQHLCALETFGACPAHRKTFTPVAQVLHQLRLWPSSQKSTGARPLG